jgi:DNA-binding transcriptional LysR family regulator
MEVLDVKPSPAAAFESQLNAVVGSLAGAGRRSAPEALRRPQTRMEHGLPPISMLRMIDAVIREGSYTAAGRSLGVTHSAISQAVSRLEDSTGTALFNRSAHGVGPTELARDLAALYNQLESSYAGIIDRSRGIEPSYGASLAVASEILSALPDSFFAELTDRFLISRLVALCAADIGELSSFDLVLSAAPMASSSHKSLALFSEKLSVFGTESGLERERRGPIVVTSAWRGSGLLAYLKSAGYDTGRVIELPDLRTCLVTQRAPGAVVVAPDCFAGRLEAWGLRPIDGLGLLTGTTYFAHSALKTCHGDVVDYVLARVRQLASQY